MGCDHLNDYVRAVIKVAWFYASLPWDDVCPWCKLRDISNGDKLIIEKDRYHRMVAQLESLLKKNPMKNKGVK